jgi:nicotinamide-nucleotide amidase
VIADLVVGELIRRGIVVAVAESCTGGQLAAAITAVPGASAIFDRGFVTYSNAAKFEMLGVPLSLIAQHGAVSREVAIAMAEGAIRNSNASMAVATTGVAGPTGGSAEKPVGLVHFALASKDRATIHREEFFGSIDRSEVQSSAVITALEMVRLELPAQLPD